MNKLQTWYQKHKGVSHAIAGAGLTLLGFYTTVPQVKAVIDGMLENHKNLSALFGAAVGIYLSYRKSEK